MSENTTTDNSALLTENDAHRHAGIRVYFTWQDEVGEGRLDAVGLWVNSTTTIKVLPEVNGAPAYKIRVNGTAKSCHGYTYPIGEDVVVSLQPNNAGELVAMCSDEEEEEDSQL
jgi:hypothetical protein